MFTFYTTSIINQQNFWFIIYINNNSDYYVVLLIYLYIKVCTKWIFHSIAVAMIICYIFVQRSVAVLFYILQKYIRYLCLYEVHSKYCRNFLSLVANKYLCIILCLAKTTLNRLELTRKHTTFQIIYYFMYNNKQ